MNSGAELLSIESEQRISKGIKDIKTGLAEWINSHSTRFSGPPQTMNELILRLPIRFY